MLTDQHGVYPLRGYEMADFLVRPVEVLAKDETDWIVPYRPAYIIINTDTSNDPGEHWVAVFLLIF